jgi:hypothetical protein
VDRLRAAVDRLARSWRALAPEQRLASIAAVVLLVTLFLPWYDKSVVVRDSLVHDKLTGFGSADFVMASVVLVAFAVLGMMFARGERRGFHLPGGDGLIVMIAGGWAALLIFYRVLDHPDVSGDGRGATIGIQWGVFVAFLAAAFLVYAGFRIRAAHRPEPPLPLQPPTRRARPSRVEPSAPAPRPRRPRPAAPGEERAIPGQLSFDEAETERLRDR